jgi:hypothetical protein
MTGGEKWPGVLYHHASLAEGRPVAPTVLDSLAEENGR